MFNSDNAREYGRKGGKTTAQRHGREHLSRIGRKGFKARAEKWFGSEAAYKEHLAKRCAYNYWKQSGRPMKYDVDGNPIWPDRYPLHPSVKHDAF
ncbi:MAG: hypothetical protein H6658_20640 [Ardenticatenaceae bacterium]|nr:hypothetical protein [Ardenticatenaceae bacterium]